MTATNRRGSKIPVWIYLAAMSIGLAIATILNVFWAQRPTDALARSGASKAPIDVRTAFDPLSVTQFSHDGEAN
jgi:hypothetical protein